MMRQVLWAEATGCFLLFATVIGSGVMAEKLAGIAPASVPGFITAQLVGVLAAYLRFDTLYPAKDTA